MREILSIIIIMPLLPSSFLFENGLWFLIYIYIPPLLTPRPENGEDKYKFIEEKPPFKYLYI